MVKHTKQPKERFCCTGVGAKVAGRMGLERCVDRAKSEDGVITLRKKGEYIGDYPAPLVSAILPRLVPSLLTKF